MSFPRIRGLELGIWGSGVRVEGTRKVSLSSFGIRASSFGVQILSFGLQVSGFGLRVSGFGFRVSGFEFQISGLGLSVPKRKGARPCRGRDFAAPAKLGSDLRCLLFFLTTLEPRVECYKKSMSLEYEPPLGTAPHFCQAFVLKLRIVPLGTALRSEGSRKESLSSLSRSRRRSACEVGVRFEVWDCLISGVG